MHAYSGCSALCAMSNCRSKLSGAGALLSTFHPLPVTWLIVVHNICAFGVQFTKHGNWSVQTFSRTASTLERAACSHWEIWHKSAHRASTIAILLTVSVQFCSHGVPRSSAMPCLHALMDLTDAIRTSRAVFRRPGVDLTHVDMLMQDTTCIF